MGTCGRRQRATPGVRHPAPVPSAHRPPELRGAVFRKRDVVAAGLLTTDDPRSSAWRRLFRGIYADADLPDSFDVRIRGARFLLPRSAVFSGRTAAYLHGARELADLRNPVEIAVPTTVRFGPVAGMRIRRVAMSPIDVTDVGTWRCTTGLRTALDLARWESLLDAVAALDLLLARAIVGIGELREGADGYAGPGSHRMREAAKLADSRAESQPESRLRVILALAGLHAVPQFTVRDAVGTFVARVDLAFPEHRLAIEYDGAWHGERDQFAKDRRRLNRLVVAGWTVLHVTAADLRNPEALVARVEALLASPIAGK
jgi:very-short-patch-repair endonuclease